MQVYVATYSFTERELLRDTTVEDALAAGEVFADWQGALQHCQEDADKEGATALLSWTYDEDKGIWEAWAEDLELAYRVTRKEVR